jgi:hypothetical protein
MGSDDEQSFQTPAEKESARRMAEAMVHFREVLAQPTIDIGSHTSPCSRSHVATCVQFMGL